MTEEADRLRKIELDIEARVSKLEERDHSGAIQKNAQAMRETIDHWNKQFAMLDMRLTAIENNITVYLQTVKQIQDNNTLALQKLRGYGPTAP